MKKVLIIDDNISIITEVRDILLMEGYEVFTAPNAYEGVDLALRVKPNLVITDINMPKMDGYALIANLKSSSESRNIPIIVMSSNSTKEYIRRALMLEADIYLKKPCSADELIASAGMLLQAA